MTRITLDPGNPLDFTEADLQALAEELRRQDPALDVEVRIRPEHGYGVTLTEVLRVIVDAAGVAADVGGTLAFADIVIEWAKARWRKDRDDHPDSEPRERAVIIYDADGRPLRTVRIEGPDAHVVEGDDTAPLPEGLADLGDTGDGDR